MGLDKAYPHKVNMGFIKSQYTELDTAVNQIYAARILEIWDMLGVSVDREGINLDRVTERVLNETCH